MALSRLVLDVSDYDRIDDLAKTYAAGYRLCVVKATEGASGSGSRQHSYPAFIEAARKAGMMVACYHFLRTSPVDAQVANFLEYAKPGPDCHAVLDWEADEVPVATAREFLHQVDEKLGRPTVLYSYESFLASKLGRVSDTFFGKHPLWIAAYRTAPAPRLQISWDRWLLWQDTEREVIPGIGGNALGFCDSSLFDGTEADLRAKWLGSFDAPFQLPPGAEDKLDLRAVQAKLIGLGYDLGPSGADGVTGPHTDAALKAYALAQLTKE